MGKRMKLSTNRDVLIGTLFLLAVLALLCTGFVYLQRKALGIDSLEDRIFRIEQNLIEH